MAVLVVAIIVCGRFGRNSDLVVAVLVLAVLVCGRFGFSVWPFWSDLWPFWLWPLWFVAVLDVIRVKSHKYEFMGLNPQAPDKHRISYVPYYCGSKCLQQKVNNKINRDDRKEICDTFLFVEGSSYSNKVILNISYIHDNNVNQYRIFPLQSVFVSTYLNFTDFGSCINQFLILVFF